MKTQAIIMIILIFIAVTPLGAQNTDEGDYALYYGKTLTGSSHYSLKSSPSSLELVTETTLIAAVQKDNRIEFHQTFTATLDGGSKELKAYRIHNQSPFKKEDSLMTFNGSDCTVERATKGASVTRNLSGDCRLPIADFHSPAGGSWNIPLLSMVLNREELHRKDSLTLPCLYSGTFQKTTLIFTKRDSQHDMIAYSMYESSEGEKNVHTLYLDARNGTIMKMESPAENFSCLRGKAGTITALPDISQAYSLPLCSDIRNCGEIKGRIKARILQEDVTIERLQRMGQTVTGTFEKGVLEGTFHTRSTSLKGLTSPALPASFSDEALKDSLAPEFLIESDDEDIRSLAKKVTTEAKTVRDAASLLGKWVFEQVKFEFTDGSAKAAMISRKGDWLPRNRLFIALCRSMGIPARMAGGYLFTQDRAGAFVWSEAYMGPQNQWVPIDTALGQIDYFPANYLTLYSQGCLDPFSVAPKIEITEHREEPRPKGTKFVID